MLSVSLNNSTGAGLAGQNILSQMSAQLTVRKERSRSLYIGGGVSFGRVVLLIFYMPIANVSE